MEQAASIDRVDGLDRYIGRLYRSALSVPPDSFRTWALTQLREVIAYDGALWGSGSLPRWQFHTVAVVGLPEDFPRALERTHAINPIVPRILANLDAPVDMRSVLPDAQFFRSEIYRRCFSRYGITRILSTGHVDPRSGLYSLLTLYRKDRRRPFSEEDRARQQRATFHLFNAASHAFFLHLMRSHGDRPAESAAAAIDREGAFHEAQPRFLELLEKHFPGRAPYTLPFPLPPPGETRLVNGLCIRCEPSSDFNYVFIWPAGPLDRLTAREREIVYAVAHGLSFKQAARRIGIAPSTVANHLYRIYRKLGIRSRSELAGLVYPTQP
ncbi:MAG: helix-turn-helix transcriptional regulator [Sinobacteraceae bacterium]|nr:helix-turn-helix transcriptional regulator [Nevskia sp.]MDI3260228.1 helix-turn-helix transcriptional regulator [Nevskiaceae bacterium]